MTLSYPKTRTVDAVEELAGVRVPDPYRWLEDGDADEVRLWQKAQNELTSTAVRDWPGFARVRELVGRHTAARFGAVPVFAGDRWFRSHLPEGASQAGVVVADEPYGDGRLVYEQSPDESGVTP